VRRALGPFAIGGDTPGRPRVRVGGGSGVARSWWFRCNRGWRAARPVLEIGMVLHLLVYIWAAHMSLHTYSTP
jgi:hypothetical protein